MNAPRSGPPSRSRRTGGAGFDPRILDEIRARLPVSQVVGRTVQLTRKGREFTALSPFTSEKTPSFFVNDDKQFYHCFSSQKHGDIFEWLKETEGLSFPEAVERLAGEAGVALPEPDPDAGRKREERKSLSDVMELAQAFFRAALDSRRGADARAYLAKRGLSEDDWASYEIGFAPTGWTTTQEALLARGATLEQLLACGLATRGAKEREPFDYFRNRILFAIRDAQGRMIGFGGRALDPEYRAKYLNSPETELFQKGRTLYRYKEARAALAKAGEGRRGLILAEGYMDAIALARAGFGEAVAPLGTALTDEQLQLAWRAGPEPVICFDGDAAGRRAAHRAIDRILPHVGPTQTARLVFLPDGQDPDDVVRAAESLEAAQKALGVVFARATPLAAAVWAREEGARPLDTPEAKADLRGRLVGAAHTIDHEDTAKQYRLDLLARFDALYGWAARKAGKDGPAAGPRAETRNAGDPRAAASALEAHALLLSLVDRPELIESCVEELAALSVPEGPLQALRAAMVSAALGPQTLDKTVLNDHFAHHGVESVLRTLRREMAGLRTSAPPDGDDAAAWWRVWAGRYAQRWRDEDERNALRSRVEDLIADGRVDEARALAAHENEPAPDAGEAGEDEGASARFSDAVARMDEALARKRARR